MTQSRSRSTRPADALVIFGITGDLAKKMTFRSLSRGPEEAERIVAGLGCWHEPWPPQQGS